MAGYESAGDLYKGGFANGFINELLIGQYIRRNFMLPSEDIKGVIQETVKVYTDYEDKITGMKQKDEVSGGIGYMEVPEAAGAGGRAG